MVYPPKKKKKNVQWCPQYVFSKIFACSIFIISSDFSNCTKMFQATCKYYRSIYVRLKRTPTQSYTVATTTVPLMMSRAASAAARRRITVVRRRGAAGVAHVWRTRRRRRLA